VTSVEEPEEIIELTRQASTLVREPYFLPKGYEFRSLKLKINTQAKIVEKLKEHFSDSRESYGDQIRRTLFLQLRSFHRTWGNFLFAGRILYTSNQLFFFFESREIHVVFSFSYLSSFLLHLILIQIAGNV
jgi:hypothetical protein